MSLKSRIFAIAFFAIMSAYSQSTIWESVSKKQEEKMFLGMEFPEKHTLYTLNLESLESVLFIAENRFSSYSSAVIQLPNGKKELQQFRVYHASNFSPELQSKFPQIQAFVAQGIDDPSAVARFSISPYGFFATISSGNFSTLVIEQIPQHPTQYIVYNQKDKASNKLFECETRNLLPAHTINPDSDVPENDGNLRTFRLAMAANSDYSSFHLQRQNIPASANTATKKAAVLSAMNEALVMINHVFERDIAVHLQLVPDNDLLIFLDASDDPYTPYNTSNNIAENILVCNDLIGVNNYDIGHVVSGLNLGGLAYVGAVCWDDYKGGAVSGHADPVGTSFYNLVLHEMGHQFGANHSFNNSCGGNRSLATSIEPGSGTTIMSYAGLCAPNVFSESISYFNGRSIQEMWNNINYGSSQCGQLTPTNNTRPSVTPGSRYIIPKSTPFILESDVTDPDDPTGTNLTYSWEQINPQEGHMPPQNTNEQGPMFLIEEPQSKSYRYMPNMQTIRVGQTQNRWEVVPAVGRVMNFSVIVRDNHPGGGSTNIANTRVSVDDNSGPFVVTSQNTPVTWSTKTYEYITWDVAGTDTGAVNTTEVKILFSEDGGYTYPHVLASNVPNTGSARIHVPSVNTTSGRVMVRGSNNIFFDINNADIVVTGELGNETNEFANFLLSPNPGSVFNLSFTPANQAPIQLTLYDLRGRLIDQRIYNDIDTSQFREQLNYSRLQNGVYFLIIKNGNHTTTKKLIKK